MDLFLEKLRSGETLVSSGHITFDPPHCKFCKFENHYSMQLNSDFQKCSSPKLVGCLSRGIDGTSSKQLRNLNFVKLFRRKVSKPTFYDLPPVPEGHPRVLDYSISKSLLVPYLKKFTTLPSSNNSNLNLNMGN